jgi:hypothetical protein
VRALVDELRLADSAVKTEPRGLTSTNTRPADIFTNAAVPGRCAALDVCVASPNASAAGDDAAEAAFKRKLNHYKDIIPELHRARISFRPMIWTADGRPHPAVTRTLRFAAERAARKSPSDEQPKAIVARWSHEISLALARRRAAMARAVLPRHGKRSRWILSGCVDSLPSSAVRHVPLEREADHDAEIEVLASCPQDGPQPAARDIRLAR